MVDLSRLKALGQPQEALPKDVRSFLAVVPNLS